MYRIKNISLDKILKSTGLTNLEDVTEDQLTDLIIDNKDLTTPLIYFQERDRLTGAFKRGDIDMMATIKLLKQSLTFSTYMDTSYWQKSHQDKAEKMKLLEKLSGAQSGNTVFEILSDAGLGFYDLRPGESVSVDVTTRWVKDVLKHQPMAKYLEIVNEDDLTEKLDAPEVRVQDLEDMRHVDLQNLAKEKGLPHYGTKDELIQRLSEKK